jgi:hypothetical protein
VIGLKSCSLLEQEEEMEPVERERQEQCTEAENSLSVAK